MEKQLKAADFVLLVCTPIYLQRFDGEDTEDGRGVDFEGVIVSQILYDAFHHSTKFILVIPDDGSRDNVPWVLKREAPTVSARSTKYCTVYWRTSHGLSPSPSAN